MTLGRRAFTLLGLAAVTGAAATSARSRSRTREIEETFPPIGQFITINGARVHYTREGNGPDLILLHGAGGNLREFTLKHVTALKDRYTVTCFDRPGLGYSDRHPDVDAGAWATEGESPAQQAQILRDASRQLGIVNPLVAGHSFGGIVAMAWALAGLDAPDDTVNAAAVVSFAGVLMPWPGGLDGYYTLNGSRFGGAVTVPLIAAFAPMSKVDEALTGVFAPQPVAAGYADYAGAPLALRPTMFRANVRQVNTLRPHVVKMAERYRDLRIPIEILHGEADDTVPINVHPRELVKIIPNAQLTALPGVGHMPHHVAFDEAIATIDRAAARAGLR